MMLIPNHAMWQFIFIIFILSLSSSKSSWGQFDGAFISFHCLQFNFFFASLFLSLTLLLLHHSSVAAPVKNFRGTYCVELRLHVGIDFWYYCIRAHFYFWGVRGILWLCFSNEWHSVCYPLTFTDFDFFNYWPLECCFWIY